MLGLAVGTAAACLSLTRCTNNPYRPGETASSTLFLAYSTPPSKLDVATSYYEHESVVMDNICESPFDYHYLRRPYELIPRASEAIPEPVYYDEQGRRLDGDPPASRVARAEYVVRLKRGLLYADHPCFARDAQGRPRYRNLAARDVRDYRTPLDFPETATRECTAEDFVTGIRRLADPRLACPVLSTLQRYILGFEALGEDLNTRLQAERAKKPAAWREEDEPIALDYLAAACPGVEVVDRHTFKIVLSRKYPQILYWMAMHFFAPVPREALEFYAEPALSRCQMNLNNWPVGTGPYRMTEYRPNQKIVLERNVHFRADRYPADGEPGDAAAGLLADAGRPMPLVDRVVMILEKEAIPSWNKFLQGYYDLSGITAEAFDRAVNLAQTGGATLSDEMQRLGIRMVTTVETSIHWFMFNMVDDVVGGYSEDRCKLRQAISIALDYNEFLDIFLNGRGISAQGPLGPGVDGYEDGERAVNPFVDQWDARRGRNVRQSLDTARRLLAEAGYPGGRRPDGRPLKLYYDHARGGDPSFVSQFGWMRRRFSELGIEVEERGTELSRFREKMDQGAFQLAESGWNADYPDPENFLFLFYGPNSKVRSQGENGTNYQRDEYDRMFEEMESMQNGPARRAIMERMVAMLRHDAPCCWGFHPVRYSLVHGWCRNVKPNLMTRNLLQYRRVDSADRARKQAEWNRPRVWPVAVFFVLLAALLAPAILAYKRHEYGGPKGGLAC